MDNEDIVEDKSFRLVPSSWVYPPCNTQLAGSKKVCFFIMMIKLTTYSSQYHFARSTWSINQIGSTSPRSVANIFANCPVIRVGALAVI
jgi:hypothetical protein